MSVICFYNQTYFYCEYTATFVLKECDGQTMSLHTEPIKLSTVLYIQIFFFLSEGFNSLWKHQHSVFLNNIFSFPRNFHSYFTVICIFFFFFQFHWSYSRFINVHVLLLFNVPLGGTFRGELTRHRFVCIWKESNDYM